MTVGSRSRRLCLAAALLAAAVLAGGCRSWSSRESLAAEAFGRGNSLREAGDADGAGAAYREALALEPDFHAAAFNLALLERDAGRFESALGILGRLRDADPGNLTVLDALGRTAWDAGDPEASLGYYREALSVFEADPGALEGAAVVLENLGRPEESLRYRRILADRRGSAADRAALAAALRDSGDAAGSRSVLEEALAAYPGDDGLRAQAALYAEEDGDWKAALRHWSVLIGAGGSAEARWHRGVIRLTESLDYAGGLEDVRAAVSAGFADEGAEADLVSRVRPDLRGDLREIFGL